MKTRQNIRDTHQAWAEIHVQCAIDGANGIYAPQQWASRYAPPKAATLRPSVLESWRILEKGPDHEFYDEAWDDVRNAYTLESDGFTVFQDGDVFIVDAETPDGFWNDYWWGSCA